MFSACIRPEVVLRPVEERHAQTIFALVDRDRQDLRQWLPWIDATNSADDTLAFIRSARRKYARGVITAGIWFQDRFAGVIGMTNLHPLNRRLEIGYWLGRDFRGRGIMTDCCRAMVRHALGEMEFNRVEIRCAPGNLRSKAIPKRLQFVQEGILREAEVVNGHYYDLEVWSLLKKDLRD